MKRFMKIAIGLNIFAAVPNYSLFFYGVIGLGEFKWTQLVCAILNTACVIWINKLRKDSEAFEKEIETIEKQIKENLLKIKEMTEELQKGKDEIIR